MSSLGEGPWESQCKERCDEQGGSYIQTKALGHHGLDLWKQLVVIIWCGFLPSCLPPAMEWKPWSTWGLGPGGLGHSPSGCKLDPSLFQSRSASSSCSSTVWALFSVPASWPRVRELLWAEGEGTQLFPPDGIICSSFSLPNSHFASCSVWALAGGRTVGHALSSCGFYSYKTAELPPIWPGLLPMNF